MLPFQLADAAKEIKEFTIKHNISPSDWELLMTEVQQGKVKVEIPNYTNLVLSVKQTIALTAIFAGAETQTFKDGSCIVPFKGEFKQEIIPAVAYAAMKLKGNEEKADD